jgi:hypothetical protein
MAQLLRLNVFKSHEDVAKQCGKVVMAGPTLRETLQAASESLGVTAVALMSTGGALVTDFSVLRDWDVVIVATESSRWSAELDGGGSSDPSPPTSSVLLPSSSPSRGCEAPNFLLRKTTSALSPNGVSRSDWVRLNVGGRVFATTRATITSDSNSMLARMFEPSEGWLSATDASGAFLIDRSPTYFEPLLNFMRHGKLILNEGINPIGEEK